MKIQNRYEYEPGKDLLGRGGFARVYRARDTLLHRDVALKVFSHSGDHRYSVLDEIRKAIGLEHPNLLRYYDVVLLEVENHLGEKEQTQIGVMELANAGDLKDFARANPGSPELYRLLKEVLQGLEYLHGKGIIHRDLKAQNILLVRQDDGRLSAKISDFGISKDTGSGGQSSSMMVGTVEYMAPEQFSPAKFGIDGKVASNLDLWSFGIMVHELLTDSTPFGRRDGDTTVEQIMAQILSTELPQDIERLPEPYRSVVRKCLVANARERIRKASELVGYFEGTPPPATPVPEADTRVYPKDGPASPSVTSDPDDATRAYPKGGPAGAGGQERPPTPNSGGATRAMPAQGTPAKQGKGPLVAAAVAVVLAIGGGAWWYAGVQEAKLREAEVKAAAEAKALADAKAAAELKAAADAKAAVDAKALADAQTAADAKAVADAKAATQVREDQERKRREEANLRLGKVFKDCAECPEMVVIPAGSFEMGSNENFIGNHDWDKRYKPAHRVRIGKAFALGKTEVTQKQWRDVMGGNPSHFSSCGEDCPVEMVNWHDAQAYIRRLSEKTGKNYRLPSETEWEYACRAGGTHTHCGSDRVESIAWHKGNSGGKTQRVASKQPNAWGLYDMSGNVWEWTQDCWNETYSGAPIDGSAWTTGACGQRVIRGGAWFNGPQDTRSVPRVGNDTSTPLNIRGFRPARVLP